jgi:hypothetical protein
LNLVFAEMPSTGLICLGFPFMLWFAFVVGFQRYVRHIDREKAANIIGFLLRVMARRH